MPPHLLFLAGSANDRRHTARAHVPSGITPIVLDAPTLPFVRVRGADLRSPRWLIIDDIHRAFPDAQTAGTRLVLTQSTYLLQAWMDVLGDGDRIIATADRAALERNAPEALQVRGPWARFEIIEIAPGLSPEIPAPSAQAPSPFPIAVLLARAFAASDPAERLRVCREAVSLDPACEVARLALGSACREIQDVGGAREAMDRAASLAPDWAAVPYERGKLWLACDDMEHARDEFARAARLMPTFSAALSNLGATLGELDDPEGALAAFEQALAHDARSFTILNNVGVVSRELGRLEESEAALRRVIALAPDFVFGHYNLGHTLFLAGKFPAALMAYEEGQRRDPELNRRQGCRLAIVRLANGDAAGADRDVWRFANAAPPDERDDLLLEAYEIAYALVTAHPALAVHQAFLDRLGAEIAKSE